MSRPCVFKTEMACLGHPEVDDERWPPVCTSHIEKYFRPMIRIMARQMAYEMIRDGMIEGPSIPRRTVQPAVPRFRRGATVSEKDRPMLDWLLRAG